MSEKLTGPLFFCRKGYDMEEKLEAMLANEKMSKEEAVEKYIEIILANEKMSVEEAIEILDCIAKDRIKFFESVCEYLNDDEIKIRCKELTALGMAIGVLMAMSKSKKN